MFVAMQSFSLAKKKAPALRVGVQHEDVKETVEYVTGVSGSGIEGATTSSDAPAAKVIPKIENTFEVGTGRRRKVREHNQRDVFSSADREIYFPAQAPSFLPTKEEITQDNERFQVAETIAAGGEVAQKGVTYGLTKMDQRMARLWKERVTKIELGRAS